MGPQEPACEDTMGYGLMSLFRWFKPKGLEPRYSKKCLMGKNTNKEENFWDFPGSASIMQPPARFFSVEVRSEPVRNRIGAENFCLPTERSQNRNVGSFFSKCLKRPFVRSAQTLSRRRFAEVTC